MRAVEISAAEYLVARALLIDGAQNAEVAVRIQRTEDTVKTHVRFILRKTRMSSRVALAVAVWSGRLDLFCQNNPSLYDELQRIRESTL